MSLRLSSQGTMGTWLYTVETIFPRVSVIERVRTAFFNPKIMTRIKPMWFDAERTGKRNSYRGTGTRMGVKRLESKKTPTPVTKATGSRRDIDENLEQLDVQASREVTGTGSSAMRSTILVTMLVVCPKETWLYRRQADPKTLHACQNTPRIAEDLTKEAVLSTGREHGRRACYDARP